MEIECCASPFFWCCEHANDFEKGETIINDLTSYFSGKYSEGVSVFSEIGFNYLTDNLNNIIITKQIKHPAIISINSILRQINLSPNQYLVKYNTNEAKVCLGKIKSTLSPTNLSKITYGVISAISYLHSIGLIHNNIKPENILIDGDFKPFLVGFDLSFPISFEPKPLGIGSPLFMAPEKISEDDTSYSTPVDVYAFGMFLYYIKGMSLEYKVKFDNHKLCRSPQQLMNQISIGARPVRLTQINDNLWNLITRCWAQDPKGRPTAEEIQENFRHDRGILFEGTAFEEYDQYVKSIDDEVSQNLKERRKNIEKELEKYRVDAIKRITEIQNSLIEKSVENKHKDSIIIQHSLQIEQLKNETVDLNKQIDLLLKTISQKQAQINTMNFSFKKQNEEDEKSKYKKIGIMGNDVDSRFIVQEVLGRGAFAEVYKVFDQEKNAYYAMKKLLKNDFQTTKDIIKEYEILDSLDFISIEKIIGMSYPTNLTGISLYMEYLPINLETAIKTNILSNTDKVRIIIEILFGMQYLVDHNFIHRDLKSNNIMLTENCKYSKICDFGSSTFISNEDYLSTSMTKGIGTLSYMSPEMLNSDEYDWRTDVYSFGILFYFIIYGNLPQQKPADKLVGKPISIPDSEEVNEIVREIIMKCTMFDPKQRPSFMKVINIIHINDFKIMKNVNSVEVYKRYIKLKEAFEKNE